MSLPLLYIGMLCVKLLTVLPFGVGLGAVGCRAKFGASSLSLSPSPVLTSCSLHSLSPSRTPARTAYRTFSGRKALLQTLEEEEEDDGVVVALSVVWLVLV